MKTFFRLFLLLSGSVAAAYAQSVSITGPSGSVNSSVAITGNVTGTTTVNVTANGSTAGLGNNGLATVSGNTWSIVWSPSRGGDYLIRAAAGAASATTTLTFIGPPGVTLALTGGSGSVPAGSYRFLNAVPSTDAIARVEFFLDGTLIGTDTSAPYNLLFNAPESLGAHALTAVAYDNTGLTGNSNVVSINIGSAIGALPSIGINSPLNGAFVAQSVTGTVVTIPISGTVADTDGSVQKVEVFVNGSNGTGSGLASAGVAVLNGNSWTINWSPTTIGTVSIVAIATDDKGNAVAAPALSVNVTDNTSPVVTLVLTPGTATLPVGAVRNIVANTTPSVGRAVVRVEFFVEGGKVGEDTTPPFTLRYTAPATPGTYILSARAMDNAGLARDAQVPLIVTAAVGASPTVNLITPGNNSTVVPNTPISLAATATAPGGNITSVQFYANGRPVGPPTPNGEAPILTPPYTTNFTPTAPGSYVIDAIATDDRGNTTVSNAATVNATFGTPTITLTSPRADVANPNAAVRVTPNVPLTIVTTATGGSGATVLLVEFLLDGVQLGTRTAPPSGITYQFSWTPDSSQLGLHVLTTRVTDTNSVSATSLPVNINVASVVGTPPTISITAPANNATLQSLSTVNLQANAFATGGTVSSVEFFLNDGSVGLATREQTTNVYRLPYNLANFNYSALQPDPNTGQYTLTYYAIAKDSNGNQTVFPATNPLQLRVTPSVSLPPSVQVIAVGATTVTAGTQFAVGVVSSDPDGTVTTVQIFANGTQVGTAANPQPGQIVTYTPQVAGRFNVYAVATDETGNTAVSSPIIVNVTGNTAPTAVLVRPTDNSTVTTVTTPVFLEATATEPDVGQGVTVTFINTANGATLATGARVGTTDTYRAIWTPTQANTFNVAARSADTAGTSTTSTVTRRVVVSNVIGIAPTVTITVPTPVTSASTANFSATAADSDGSIVSVEFFLNRNSLGQATRDQLTNIWRIPAPFAGVALGNAEVQALARDSAGNVAASPISTVNITAASSIAPSITLTPSSTNVAFSRQVQLTSTARDTDGTVTSVQYFANGTNLGTSTNSANNYLVTWTSTQAGSFNVYAIATDNTGNITVATSVVVTVRRNNPVLDDSAFILQTYLDLANTGNVNPLVLENLDAQLAAGTLTRADLANNLITEPGFVAPVNLLAAYYVIMGQWPTPANYTTLLATARTSLPNAMGAILSSNEYFAKFGVVPTVALLNNPNSTIPAPVFLSRLHQGAGLGAPSALDELRFRNNDTASLALGIGRGYNVATLNTALAEFITFTNVNNTALFKKARAAAIFYQLNRPPSTVSVETITARVEALAALPETPAMVEAVLRDVLYAYRYVTILKHPQSVKVAPRSGVLFSVEALGAPPLSYQWLLNGSPLAGEDGPTLSLTNVNANRVGAYTAVITTSAGSATSDPATLELSSLPTRLGNISTRGMTSGGNQVLIGGFVVSGAANQTRQMLIRVIGPSLTGLGVTGVLADPRLEVYNGTNPTPILSNNDWGTQTGGAAAVNAIQQATNRVGAFTLANGTTDAVVLAALSPGNYTVQARGPAATSSGVVLVEVYDATPLANAGPKAINVSTRGLVGTGNNILIAGFVINGEVSRRVLIRGVGPTLQRFGLGAGALLADPQITLINQNTTATIKTNNDWAAGDDAAIIAAAAASGGAFPLANGSKDAAMILMLPPGVYTVQLSGVNGGTGIGIVEVYDVDP